MTYKMFLDDERFPVYSDFKIIRTSQEAIDYVLLNGMPSYISFDHDLGGDDTSMVFVHWIVAATLNNLITIPHDFEYSVHSQNPIGKKNIEGLMDCFLNFIKE